MIENLLAVNNLEAQHSVIGSMLRDGSCVGLVATKLSADDFSDTTCRNAFICAKQLYSSGRPVDRITLQDAVGGGEAWANWAAQLLDVTPTAANVAAYADIVREQTSFFALRGMAQELLETVNLEQASKIVKAMNGQLVSSSQVHTWTAAELAEDFIERLTTVEKPKFLRWGMPTPDLKIQAVRGDYILLGGYSSSGKTLLSLQFALVQASSNRVGYYTLETQPEKMADRMFAYLSGLSLPAIKRHDLSRDEVELAKKAAELFAKRFPIEFVHAARWTVEDIIAHALSRGYEIIYIDYVQLIEGDGREPEKDRIARVSRKLKLFGQVCNVTIVGLAQFHRETTDKDGKKRLPDMQSFYGSGQLERDADIAFVLYPKDSEDNDSPRILFVAKNKDGPRFKRELSFRGATQTMTEVVEDKSRKIAKNLQKTGRAAKKSAWDKHPAQVTFTELTGSDSGNPFADT